MGPTEKPPLSKYDMLSPTEREAYHRQLAKEIMDMMSRYNLNDTHLETEYLHALIKEDTVNDAPQGSHELKTKIKKYLDEGVPANIIKELIDDMRDDEGFPYIKALGPIDMRIDGDNIEEYILGKTLFDLCKSKNISFEEVKTASQKAINNEKISEDDNLFTLVNDFKKLLISGTYNEDTLIQNLLVEIEILFQLEE